jgi:hypothetical protein
MVLSVVSLDTSGPEAARSAAPGLGLVHTEQGGRETAESANSSGNTLTVTLEDSRRRASRCRRGTITRARLLDGQVKQGGFRGHWYLLTFTYRNSADWEPRDLKGWLQATRKQFQRKGAVLHYVWVAELQKRGAIHYHALVWVPRGHFIRKPDRCGLWPKGCTQIAKARNAVGYLAKYAGKGLGSQCDADGRELKFPKGARIQGAGGLALESRIEARWWMAPRWLRDSIGEMTDVRRVPGGYVDKVSGQIHLSPWEFIGFTPGLGAALFRERTCT